MSVRLSEKQKHPEMLKQNYATKGPGGSLNLQDLSCFYLQLLSTPVVPKVVSAPRIRIAPVFSAIIVFSILKMKILALVNIGTLTKSPLTKSPSIKFTYKYFLLYSTLIITFIILIIPENCLFFLTFIPIFGWVL